MSRKLIIHAYSWQKLEKPEVRFPPLSPGRTIHCGCKTLTAFLNGIPLAILSSQIYHCNTDQYFYRTFLSQIASKRWLNSFARKVVRVYCNTPMLQSMFKSVSESSSEQLRYNTADCSNSKSSLYSFPYSTAQGSARRHHHGQKIHAKLSNHPSGTGALIIVMPARSVCIEHADVLKNKTKTVSFSALIFLHRQGFSHILRYTWSIYAIMPLFPKNKKCA